MKARTVEARAFSVCAAASWVGTPLLSWKRLLFIVLARLCRSVLWQVHRVLPISRKNSMQFNRFWLRLLFYCQKVPNGRSLVRLDEDQVRKVAIVSQTVSADGRSFEVVFRPKADRFSADFSLGTDSAN